ncbi:hypothetical protein [Nitrosomonas sp. PY1]|uniref:hypothetical protein n=1 Tax=Nitrosomonas sp. PY1 TaxID=1803906 RepID=UPI001FC8C4CD|nr:hypothetical protein [Nitrosomonas sp. PY1]
MNSRDTKNGIQDKATENNPLTRLQLQRNKAHAGHILQAMAYNLKRLPRLYVERHLPRQPQASCVF